MILGKVTGNLWATKKDEGLCGQKLMIVETDTGTVIATDSIGAGSGDTVILCMGSSARIVSDSPADTAIVGIVDSFEKTNTF